VRFVVLGAGAVGGVVGARLHQSGHDVVLVARGAHLDAIVSRGLRLESHEGTATLEIEAVPDVGGIEWRGDEVVLLAVKSQDTEAALGALARLAPPGIAVVCLQNGVENERRALRYFDDVYGVCVMCPATHLEAGVVGANSSPITGLFDVGRYPSGTDDRVQEYADAMERSTFESVVRPDVMRWKYAKLLLNLGNAVQALCAPSDAAGDLAVRAREEGRACLDAAGIDYASEEEDRRRRSDKLHVRAVGGRARSGGSTWQSLARAAGSVETDFLNGEVCLLGRRCGVPTPINAALQRSMRRAVEDRLPPASMDASRLLAQVAGRT
jgi:2-dehydropantoate 2-reductase